jgi:hypothetical protein
MYLWRKFRHLVFLSCFHLTPSYIIASTRTHTNTSVSIKEASLFW